MGSLLRIACIHAPELALQAVLRRSPEHRGDAVGLASGPGGRANIIACTQAAARLGIRKRMTVAQAQAVAGPQQHKMRVVLANPVDTAAAAAALADVAYGFAPQIESEHDGARVFLAVHDLGHLYPLGERAVAQAVAAHAERVGLRVRVGIASSKGAARTAARTAGLDEIAVIPPGDEARFLAPVPIRLGLEGATMERGVRPARTDAQVAAVADSLDSWGVKTLGQLANLPVDEATLRLGPIGAWLHRLGSGHDTETFVPQLPPSALEESLDLDYEIQELDPLAFVLRGLLDRAMARLQVRGLACAGLSLKLALSPRGIDTREVPLGAPTRESGALLQHVRLDLSRCPPESPVVGATVIMCPARVRAAQMDLWRPAGPAPEKLIATIARLQALVGVDNVGAPALVDTFAEEAVAMRPYTAAPPIVIAPEASTPAPTRLGFRRFRPPAPVDVIFDRDGPSALRAPALALRIMVAAGPYRSEGQWWQGDGFSRDYWDVQASDGAVYRMHQNRNNGSWYLDGYYD